jgi:hypothetical protein
MATQVLFAVVMIISYPVRGATPQQVQQAIDKAQAFLLVHRNKDGTWEEADKPVAGKDTDLRLSTHGRQWGGLTALSTYALLASGKDWRSPEMTPAVQFLLHGNIQGTYALGLSSQIVLFLPREKTRELVARNVLMLGVGLIMPPPRTAVEKWPPETGFYGYWTGTPEGTDQPLFDPTARTGGPQPADWYDRSNSQYAVLGMWALEQAGGQVPPQYWQIVDTAWKRAQSGEGGWNYRQENDVTPSMTAAGIATLFITQDYTLHRDWGKLQGGVKDPFIERGLAWMDNHIDEAINSSYYTLYGIERIGAASGRRFFGTTDWFELGADFLISHQQQDGSWQGDRGAVADTCFGLLFLARGREPLLMEKLEYQADPKFSPPPDVWNERPRDVANLASWVGRQQESAYNWQIVNLELKPEQLHDAPILYISGSRALSFDSSQQDKLRAFVEQGGMILGNADGGEASFGNTFMKLGRELFPRYSFKAPSAGDLIWREQFSRWQMKPKVMELSNGVRKLMLLIPTADAGRAWQTRFEPKNARHDEPLLELGANIFLYASDKRNVLTRGETYLVKPDPKIKASRTIKVARVEVGENPDPEPAGWPRLAAIMHNRFKTDLEVTPGKPGQLAGYRIAHLTGTGVLKLSPQDREALGKFVRTGGTLIVDAAGGDSIFADAAQTETEAIFGTGSLKVLPPASPLYTQKEIPITQIAWRHYALDHVADHKHPQIMGIAIGKRLAVFLSREDLSAGLVGENVDGINGYDPKTASDLMAALLLYSVR